MSFIPKEIHIQKMEEEIARQKELRETWTEYRQNCRKGSPMDREAERKVEHAERTIKRLEKHIQELNEDVG